MGSQRQKTCWCFTDYKKDCISFTGKSCVSNETKKVYVIEQYDGIKFCVKNEVVEVTDFVE